MLGCPFCAHVIPGAEKFLGKTGRCPKCKGTYRFPATPDGATVGVQAAGAAPRPAQRPGAAPAAKAVAPRAAARPGAVGAARPPLRGARPGAPARPPAPPSDPLLPDDVPMASLADPSPAPIPTYRPPRAPRTSGGGSTKSIGGIVGTVIVVALIGWRVVNQTSGKSYQTFNDAVVNAYQGAGEDPMDSLADTWSEGRPIDRAQLQAAYDQSLAAVEGVEKKLKAIDVPSKASAQKFYDKAKEFAAIKREILEKGYRPLIGFLSDAATKQSQVDGHMEATMGAMLPRILTALMEADAAQKEFAKEVGLKLQ